MKFFRALFCLLLALAAGVPVVMAQAHRDPITDAEEEKIREVTDVPALRLKLYGDIISSRIVQIEELAKTPAKGDHAQRIHNLLEDYATLVDEFQANFDEYESYETNQRMPVPDVRKVLPKLKTQIGIWVQSIAALPANPDYDFPRETATDANEELQKSFAEFETNQTTWWRDHKKAEPDPNVHSPNIR